jgi:RNA-directed DNA polymerase
MQESYREGPASHPDPESCGGAREDAAEASIGVHAGKVLSREIRISRRPTLLSEAEGTNRTGDSASPCGPDAVGDPWHA